MAMSDVSNMAHVSRFSHLTIPMLWFEIALDELPPRLEKRFALYLNMLPMVERVGLYGSFILGAFFSIIAVFQVAMGASRRLTGQKNRNLANGSAVYNQCEEKLIENGSEKRRPTTIEYELGRLGDDMQIAKSFNIITRDDQFELEDDEALSDIDYNNDDDGEESTSNCSDQVSFVDVVS